MRLVRAVAMMVATLVALTVLPATVGAAPTLAISPASGPPETEFTALLGGFEPAEKIVLRLETEETPPRALLTPAVTIGADGTYRLVIPALGLRPGGYTLAALRGATVVASARFTVTTAPRATPTRATPPAGGSPAPTATRPPMTPPPATATPPPSAAPAPPATGSGGNLPGLPATGGGSAPDAPTPWGRARPLGALALLALALLVYRRRGSWPVRGARRFGR